jgi:tellurite resistance protein
MIWLSTSTISRLRDQLQARGAPPSIAGMPLDLDAIRKSSLQLEWGPFVDVMHWMMSADKEISQDERDVLLGAVRNLSDSSVRTHEVEWLLEQSAASLAASGGAREHLSRILQTIRRDSTRAEVVFVLAAAVSFADGAIADEENDLINFIAEELGIGDDRASVLLDEVEADLKDR